MSASRVYSPIESSGVVERAEGRQGSRMDLPQEQTWGRRRRQVREEPHSTTWEVTEEELIRELALLGFTHIPRERLLEFKQDLEELRERRAGLIPGPEGDQARGPRPDPTSDTSRSSSSDLSDEPSVAWQANDPRQSPAAGSSPDGDMESEAADMERGACAGFVPRQRPSSSRGSALIGQPRGNATQEPSQRTRGPPQNDSYLRSMDEWMARQLPSVLLTYDPRKSRDHQAGHLEPRPSSPGDSSSHDTDIQRPIMRRKVLRRREDGQTQVSDESLISETGLDLWRRRVGLHGEAETETDSGSSSSGSLLDLWGPKPAGWDRHKSFIRPRIDPLLDGYRKRTDPVAKYKQYKQDWDAMQGLVEKNRKQLRWGIREQMMCKPPQVIARPHQVYIPNEYVVPTEKKRYALRWGVRYDLVNGLIPQPR